MTDVIFLLLIFFMVTSTFVFPTGLDITLPKSSEQSTIKPSTRVYVDSIGNISAAYAEGDAVPFDDTDALAEYLKVSLAQDTTQAAVAVYADENTRYARIVDVLSAGSANGIKMVLATTPSVKPDKEAPAKSGEHK